MSWNGVILLCCLLDPLLHIFRLHPLQAARSTCAESPHCHHNLLPSRWLIFYYNWMYKYKERFDLWVILYVEVFPIIWFFFEELPCGRRRVLIGVPVQSLYGVPIFYHLVFVQEGIWYLLLLYLHFILCLPIRQPGIVWLSYIGINGTPGGFVLGLSIGPQVAIFPLMPMMSYHCMKNIIWN